MLKNHSLAIALLAVASAAASATTVTVTIGNPVPNSDQIYIPTENIFSAGPIHVAEALGGGYTYTSTNATNQGGSVFGWTDGYGFGSNGYWDSALTMIGVNDSYDVFGVSDTFTIAFDNPINDFGAFFNYVPGGSTTTPVTIYDAGGTIIDTYYLSFLTDGSTDSGLDINFNVVGDNIGKITFSDNYIGIAEPNGGPTPTPEPSSLILLGTGTMGLAGFLRRKMAARSK
jgi:hypothetical protein